MARKFVTEQPGAATDIENGILFKRQMFDKEVVFSLQRRGVVILHGEFVE